MSTAKAVRTTTRQASRYVKVTMPFKNSNAQLYGEWRNEMYVVYSYGQHFPIYIFEPTTRRWFANEDKYSRTTTTHQSCAHPGTETYPLSTHGMIRLINSGYDWLVSQRLTGGHI
jgi:hypothetical protein